MKRYLKGFSIMILWLAEIISSLALGAWASEIKSDENVQIYPSVAHLNESDVWEAAVTIWVYEQEVRPGVKNIFARWLGIDMDELTEEQKNIYEARTQLFRFDSERNKKITLQIADGGKVKFPLTNAQGISQKKLIYRFNDSTPKTQEVKWVSLKVIMPAKDQREFSGQLMLVPREGLSVVSDIDDTIKASNVLDKKELLLNTFVRPFIAADGMVKFYQALAIQNPSASFHYVSASPHQLYPALDDFISGNEFPAGSVHLRHIKVTEEMLSKGSSSARHKHKVIRGLIAQFPARKFVLIGDSGEADPEIYGVIAKDYPQQVLAVFIRNVTGEDTDAPRYQKIRGENKSLPWYIFTDPGVLPVKL